MIKKRNNKYKIQLKELELKDGSPGEKSLEFEFDNHDNLFDIIGKVKEMGHFKEDGQTVEFAVGLKLFSEVMLKNKDNPLFEDFRPAFMQFMKRLKEQPA